MVFGIALFVGVLAAVLFCLRRRHQALERRHRDATERLRRSYRRWSDILEGRVPPSTPAEEEDDEDESYWDYQTKKRRPK
jgi:hypothetical protein